MKGCYIMGKLIFSSQNSNFSWKSIQVCKTHNNVIASRYLVE